MLLPILWQQGSNEKGKYFVSLCSLAETLVHGPDWAEWKFIVMFLKKQPRSKSLGWHSSWTKPTTLSLEREEKADSYKFTWSIISHSGRNLHILHRCIQSDQFIIITPLLDAGLTMMIFFRATNKRLERWTTLCEQQRGGAFVHLCKSN